MEHKHYIEFTLTLNGNQESIESAKQIMKSSISLFDFDRIIPEPKGLLGSNCLYHEGSVMANVGMDIIDGNNDGFGVLSDLIIPQKLDEIRNKCQTMENNRKVYGYRTLDSWRQDNWGTDSNAYDVTNKENVFHFKANDYPTKVMETLSKWFPDIEFNVFTRDVNVAENEVLFKGGELHDREHSWSPYDDLPF